MKIGVLALQGNFREHLKSLLALNIFGIEVKTIEDLNTVDMLIIPGGESTAMSIINPELIESLKQSDIPMWGTCAGAILLSKIGKIDCVVIRNYYGSQMSSFQDIIDSRIESLRGEGVFIRAPYIKEITGNNVEILATLNNHPVAIKQKNIMITTFHPEMTDSLEWHKLFLIF